MVSNTINYSMPIYTVHDNFITTPEIRAYLEIWDYKNQPIPKSIFDETLNGVKPHRNVKQALWEKKCKELHDYYHSYISGVCGLCDLKDLSSIEKSGVDYQEKLDPYHGLRIATTDLSGQSLMCGNCEEIVSIIMYLLIKYAYPLNADFGKFTIHYVMKIPVGRIPFSICKAITFREGGQDIAMTGD
nr:putative ATP synthase, F0 complex, subunit A [Ipomoea batatas]